jgi:hypothetical protein
MPPSFLRSPNEDLQTTVRHLFRSGFNEQQGHTKDFKERAIDGSI